MLELKNDAPPIMNCGGSGGLMGGGSRVLLSQNHCVNCGEPVFKYVRAQKNDAPTIVSCGGSGGSKGVGPKLVSEYVRAPEKTYQQL
jgi:hypothetical protein